MSKRPPPGHDDLGDEERRAIAEIRRQLDAEFGPLEPAQPLRVEPTARPRAPRPRAHDRLRAIPRFLLGAVLGGAAGGVAGALTTLLWFSGTDHHPSLSAPVASDAPAAATRESVPERAALEAALNDWLDATRTGDVERQMRFYPARVPVYYTWRNVRREAVRDEKLRVFGTATRLEIATDAPTVELAADRRSAVSRFRKRYVIEGPVVRRRGAVVQELRWARTPEGWQIVAERDAEVLGPGASRGPERARPGGTIDPAR